MERLSYLDGDDLLFLIDSEAKNNDLEEGRWCILEWVVDKGTGDKDGNKSH